MGVPLSVSLKVTGGRGYVSRRGLVDRDNGGSGSKCRSELDGPRGPLAFSLVLGKMGLATHEQLSLHLHEVQETVGIGGVCHLDVFAYPAAGGGLRGVAAKD